MSRKVTAAAAGAPQRWQELYNTVLKMRQQIVAPVDVIGCDRLHRSSSPEHARFETLVALMLSAQTRDYCTAEAVAALQELPGGLTATAVKGLTEAEIVACIKSVGMHNAKAKYLKATAEKILTKFGGRVPKTLDGVLSLPGVGPKMAHLFMQCDGNVSGIGVDVHVHRIISQRWGWVPKTVRSPEDTRIALEAWLPRRHWGEINEILVGFGQTVCLPRLPKCHLCAANNLCPSAFKEVPRRRATPPLQPPPRSGTPTLRGDESAEELLRLCGGSAKELAARGWLELALPAVKIPESILQRLPAPPQAKRHRKGLTTSQSHLIPNDHRGAWQLAEIEDLCSAEVPPQLASNVKPKAGSAAKRPHA